MTASCFCLENWWERPQQLHAWGYFPINSIAKGDGHYLVLAQHASTVFKINDTDGGIIWRLGGSRTDFELGPDVEFGF
ncbi:arylsulfotransferase (ASST) domain-containing protein [Hirsutella rhossiliensis]|uniref:Arylsulfotransferase (ASST) domain-containing protein n=1 Tax=Hirsutella rhossiliensis TaxID=111463 RepID=A0A9P8MRI2_9HYPO|nr:arylsulfotransferase (ASST) domain-containing protein [Hirsutella rhossiliensis]KAH0960913.1 arylsulfotransferase (ASST) domain-containing protein [Hirsutella rhossiliensis]